MDILYKYVTESIALTCIPDVGDGTLRATQPAALNDPFECAVTTPYVFPDETEENSELPKFSPKSTKLNQSRQKMSTARGENTVAFSRVNC